MKCVLNPTVKSLSGKCGGVLYKTFTKPDGTTETRAYMLPRRDNGKYGYERKTKLSDAEMQARNRFFAATQLYKKMTDEQMDKYMEDGEKTHYRIYGKEYKTLRGYVIARLFADGVV